MIIYILKKYRLNVMRNIKKLSFLNTQLFIEYFDYKSKN